MSHIHLEPQQHDTTVSAYIVRLDTDQPQLMLHMHKKIHKYLQFGGHVELTENPWQAITHELVEESGYDLDQLQILQPRTRLTKLTDATLHPYPVSYLTHRFGELDHYHTDVAFAFTTDQKPRHTVGDDESSDIRLFSADELRRISHVNIPENVREIGIFILEAYINESIPVSTAQVS